MITTVTSPEDRVAKRKGSGLDGNSHRRNGYRGGGGKGGGGGNGGEGGNHDDDARNASPKRHRIGMCVALASILMLFGALISAYVALAGSSEHWRSVAGSPFIWLSTVFILLSSGTFEAGRRCLKRGNGQGYRRWLLLTVVLGTGFLVSQLLAWQQLADQGLYLRANPYSAFFYLLTGTHGVHLLGGLSGLYYLLFVAGGNRKEEQADQRQEAAASIMALYWHFMDALWVGLLLLLLWK
ncbi:MAG: heme-copper oxidase subunit III [Pyrinomonadaceae bacterium]|nr:heme-copper oxidase subunit III [Pyrinomonadaceae bacterium]